MDPASKVAPCAIYFGANGGTFTELGNPIWEEDVRALCGRAHDCGHCQFLHQWVAVQQSKGFSISWECVRCIKKTYKPDMKNDIERVITGYYQAGRRRGLAPDDPDYDQDQPGLEGCTRIFQVDDEEVDKKAGEVCGWESSFLQLVLRRKRTGA